MSIESKKYPAAASATMNFIDPVNFARSIARPMISGVNGADPAMTFSPLFYYCR